MSDDELDRDWVPSGRPQSTMARNFSLALNDLFKIDNCVADLDAVVSEKKKVVSNQTSELEALEARLRATEERLKKASGGSPPPKPSGRSSPHPRTPLADTFAASPTKAATPTSPLHTEHKNASRPQTKDGRKQDTYAAPLPGALPPTPGASEDGDTPQK
jgi:uncharacterized coiled-coil protein SlyX